MALIPFTSLLTGSSSPFLAAGDIVAFVDVDDLTQSVNGSTVKGTVTQFFAQLPVPVSIKSSSVAAFAVGRQGVTSPAFLVDAGTASCVTGLKITAAAAAAGVALVVVSSGTNEALTINAKGTGTITFCGTSTGAVFFGTDFGPSSTFSATYAGTTATFNCALGNSGYYSPALGSNSSITITAASLKDGHTYKLRIFDPNGKTLTLNTYTDSVGGTQTLRPYTSALPSTAFTAGKVVTIIIDVIGQIPMYAWMQEA